jgi:polysaccharide pyruvyl transferase WcaK-like protein
MPAIATRPVAVARGALRRVGRIDPISYVPRRRRPASGLARLGVVGYYGWGNYGDELFLDVFREHLGQAAALRPLVHSGLSLAERLGAGVRDSDAILIGGGDLVVPWSGASRYWERSYLRRPVFLSGLGVPMWRAAMPHVVERLASFVGHASVRSIGVRDEESAAWVREHLRPAAPVVTTPDLVWARTLASATRPPGPPVFGVVVRSGKSAADLRHVRRLCERAIERGYRVRRIVAATGHTRALDERSVEALGLPETELVATDDLAAITRAIGECTVLASMKFHPVIAAAMQGVAPIPMMPTTKNQNLMRSFGRPDTLIGWGDPALPDVLDAPLDPVAPAVVEDLRAAAKAHLAELRQQILDATG